MPAFDGGTIAKIRNIPHRRRTNVEIKSDSIENMEFECIKIKEKRLVVYLYLNAKL